MTRVKVDQSIRIFTKQLCIPLGVSRYLMQLARIDLTKPIEVIEIRIASDIHVRADHRLTPYRMPLITYGIKHRVA